MGAESLKMSYEDMQAEIAKLSQYAEEFETTTSSMTSSVTTLCDGWANNFSQTLEVVRSLIQSTSDYIADMQAVDSAYSKSKVSVG